MKVSTPKDLLALVADADILAALRGLFDKRRKSLSLADFTFEFAAHPERDPGCRLRCQDFLAPFIKQYRFALVVFDRDGSGTSDTRENVERDVESRLAGRGWKDRSAAIAIEPEIEQWVWNDSPHVATELGWKDQSAALDQFLRDRGFLPSISAKPTPPKEAMEAVMRAKKKRRSSSVYEKLARSVGLASCSDAAFHKLRDVLQGWFPAT